MRVIFFGTPGFAVPSLEGILHSRHKVAAVVTQPDRPKGRSMEPVPSPVKDLAEKTGAPILQPVNLKEKSTLDAIRSFHADLAVVVAYGRIFPKELIEAFPRGAIDLHASLLPKYRGAAPIQWALIGGETQTGVTLFQLDEQLDHGPILLQATAPVQPSDTAVTLGETLSRLGGRVLLEALDGIEAGSLRPKPQDHVSATEAPRLKKEDGIIDWGKGCREIHNRVRGVQPWPGAMTGIKGKLLKLFLTTPDEGRTDSSGVPGKVAAADPASGIWVQTGRGQLRIHHLQLAGGRILEAEEFLRGHPDLLTGAQLTPPLRGPLGRG